MKKNIFKKLSFVLALAMLISCIAPAAGVFAAAKPALNATTKYLHLSGIAGPSEYDFNVSNKQTGWKYAWSSANENVASVDAANGVTTATGVGSTKVTVKITKDGKAVASLSATVVVRDNIETVKIANAPEKALKVNDTFDFNRTFVTESGSTVKTSSVTRWTVDKTTATIDNSGNFTATEAGEYTVTAYAFQSAAKYEAWKTSKDASLVLDTDEVKVTVDPSIVSAKQADADTFVVTFDSDMSKTDLKTAAVLYQVIAGKQVSTGTEKIKAITLDSTGKVATVDMYAALGTGVSYNFVYKTLTGTFTSATKAVDKIAGIVFDDFTVNVTSFTNMITKVKAVDSNGVVIYDGSVAADAAVIGGYVSFTYGGDQTKGYVSSSNAYIYTKGYAATITAKFTSYVYNSTTLTYDTKTFSDSAIATGVVTDTSVNTSTMQFQVAKTTPTSDSTWLGTLSLAAGDTGYSIALKCKTNDDADNFNYTKTAVYTYVSSDTSKLLISGTNVYPIAQGTVTVVVKNSDGAAVTTFEVNISAARSFASVSQSTASVTVGNNATYGETGNVGVVAKDSMNTVLVPTLANISAPSFVNVPSNADTTKIHFQVPSINTDTTSADYGKVTLAVDAKTAVAGAYYVKYQITLLGVTKDVYFTIIVLESNTTDTKVVSSWKVELSDATVDLKANYNDAVTVDVYGYNAAGVRVDQLATSDFTIDVLSGSTTVIDNSTTASIPVVTGVTGAAVVVNRAVGTYSVIAYVTTPGLSHFAGTGRVADSYISASNFAVTDTTALTKTLDDAALTAGYVVAAAKEAYTFYLNGTAIDESKITSVSYSVGNGLLTATPTSGSVTSLQNLYIASVTYTVTDATTGAHIDYVFTVGSTFAVQ